MDTDPMTSSQHSSQSFNLLAQSPPQSPFSRLAAFTRRLSQRRRSRRRRPAHESRSECGEELVKARPERPARFSSIRRISKMLQQWRREVQQQFHRHSPGAGNSTDEESLETLDSAETTSKAKQIEEYWHRRVSSTL
uniref:Uncharacterized protein n=1 Tax=Ditylenchus dipsaci TaxID=166011 RepID=A0A915CM02_9BILA